MRRKRHGGFSLMEVLLATSILLACLIVLGQLAFVGRKHAEDAAVLTNSQLICQTELNEILIGAAPVASVDRQPVDGHPGWVYSVEVEPLERLGLVTLRVTVSQEDTESPSESTEHTGKRFTLTRWMHRADRSMNEDVGPSWQEASPYESVFNGGFLP